MMTIIIKIMMMMMMMIMITIIIIILKNNKVATHLHQNTYKENNIHNLAWSHYTAQPYKCQHSTVSHLGTTIIKKNRCLERILPPKLQKNFQSTKTWKKTSLECRNEIPRKIKFAGNPESKSERYSAHPQKLSYRSIRQFRRTLLLRFRPWFDLCLGWRS